MRRVRGLKTMLAVTVSTATLIVTPLLLASSLTSTDARPAGSPQSERIPDAAWDQLRANSRVVVAEFDPQAPSYVRASREVREDHRVDNGPVPFDVAAERAADATGLARESILGSSLVSVSALAHGYVIESREGLPEVLPIYDGTAAWAIEFASVDIPVGQSVADREKGAPAKVHTASMIVFVDAYTGEFMLGSQYDRP